MMQATATAENRVEDSKVTYWLDNPVLAAAGEKRCEELAARHPVQLCPEGETLINAGQPVDQVLVLHRGVAQAFHQVADGRQTLARLVHAPALIGDAEAISGLPWLTNVVALEPLELSWLPASTYLQLLERDPRVMRAGLRHLAALSCVGTRNERQVFTLLEQRLANLLLSLAELEHPDGDTVSRLSLAEIARCTGTIRRTVAKVVATLVKRGLIARRGSGFTLLRRQALEDLAAPIRHGLTYRMGMPLARLVAEEEALEATIEVRTGPGSLPGRRYAVGRELLVGRRPDCRVQLPVDTVDEHHCRVFRASTGWRFWVEDLGSLNGTLVDGTPVRRAVLAGGEVIKVGSVELVFHLRRAQA